MVDLEAQFSFSNNVSVNSKATPHPGNTRAFEFLQKKLSSPLLCRWASNTIKCFTVRAGKNCQIPLPLGMPVVLECIL